MSPTRKSIGFWLLALPDTVILYVSLFLTLAARYPNGIDAASRLAHIKAFSVIFLLWLVVLFIHGLFEFRVFRRYTGLLFNLVLAMGINLLLAVLYFYFQPNLILTPRRFLLIETGFAFILLLGWHLLIKYILKNRLKQGVFLFSFNNELAELEREIKIHPYLGFAVLGHLNENTLDQAQFNKNAGIILPEEVRTNQQALKRFYALRTMGVSFYNHRDFYEDLLRKVYLSRLNEAWFLENVDYQEKRLYNLVKRLVDIILGLVGFIVFVISWPFVAALIKLSSKGPVLFVQERVGKGGKIFKVYKYRTMSGGATNTWTEKNDPRITGVGRFLRKTRVDEWPQFLNLLLGNMSLVGPRPEQPHLVEKLKSEIPFYDERHLVKPGLTGWAQLNNTYASSAEETMVKLQYDLYYIKHRSILFDLEIILKTLYYIFTWQGK